MAEILNILIHKDRILKFFRIFLPRLKECPVKMKTSAVQLMRNSTYLYIIEQMTFFKSRCIEIEIQTIDLIVT